VETMPPLGQQRRHLMLLIICGNKPLLCHESATSTVSPIAQSDT
jgi:hypothetical protein